MTGNNADSSQQVAPRSPVSETKDEKVELERRNSYLELQVSETKEEKVELEKRNSYLELQVSETNEEKVELEKRNSYLELQVSETNEEKVELEKRNSYLELQVSETNEEKVELEKRNSDLELQVSETKEEKVELERRNSDLELQVSEIKEEKMQLKKQVKLMKREESGWKKEAETYSFKGCEKADKKKRKGGRRFVGCERNEENVQQIVSPLQNCVDRLPNTMKTILAPKGSIDEFGVFMGGFVNVSAYVVTRANRKEGITAMSAFASLMSLMISTMFNNIVAYILTVQNDQPRVVKAFTSLPWLMLGGLLPIAIGGFIPSWGIRAIVTASVTLVLKIVCSLLGTQLLVPKKYGFCFVILGMVGTAIAAAFPEILELIVKRSVKKASPSICI